MKKKYLLLLLIFSLHIQAESCETFKLNKSRLTDVNYVASLPESIIGHYQQPGPMQKDIVGDFSLLRKAQSVPKKMWWELTKNHKAEDVFIAKFYEAHSCAELLFEKTYVEVDIKPVEEKLFNLSSKDVAQIFESNLSDDVKFKLVKELHEKKVYLEGTKNPVKVKPFVLMVNQIMQEELANGITPQIGRVHVWSDEIRKSKSTRGSWVLAFSKILIALARGETSQYLVTGKEQELEQWLITQPLRSVEAHEIIRTSYKLNKGDMYLCLLTIENVLSRYWRHEKREQLPITLRLKPFINSFGNQGDLFGSWYHFFGVMFYGYVAGAMRANLVASIETVGSHLLSGFENEKQEDYVNSYGGEIGAKIKQSIINKKYEKIKPFIYRMDSDYYFDTSEDFQNKIKKKLDHL